MMPFSAGLLVAGVIGWFMQAKSDEAETPVPSFCGFCAATIGDSETEVHYRIDIGEEHESVRCCGVCYEQVRNGINLHCGSWAVGVGQMHKMPYGLLWTFDTDEEPLVDPFGQEPYMPE